MLITLLRNMRRRILSHPRTRTLVDAVRLFRMYGSINPTRLQLSHSGHDLYVDPREPRGRAVLKCRAAGQPRLKAIWHAAVRRLAPKIVVDVGLNYGEFLFDDTYRQDAILLGIEANDRLRPWIERSAEGHPNSSQMQLVFALASDAVAQNQAFYVDLESSGSSSAVRRPDRALLDRREVPSVTVDSFFDHQSDESLAAATLLFKIDVEGYEPLVVRGMQRLLSRCRRRVGIVEYNSRLLQAAGVHPGQYLEELSSQFAAVLVSGHVKLQRLVRPSLAELQGMLESDDVETDLILCSLVADANDLSSSY